jgi:hypothetical protein
MPRYPDDVDAATRRLYEAFVHSPVHGPFIARLNELRGRKPLPGGRIDATLAVAPGAFYREFSHTGADARLLAEQAQRLGFRTELIPTASTGGLLENARTICDWLARRSDERIILASVSKGGSDVKLALAQPDAEAAFCRVVAWINVSGILSGSPLVNWLFVHKLRSWSVRAMFWWRGYGFDVIRDMRHGPGSILDFPLPLPEHVRLISLAGFPLATDLTNRMARRFHRRLAPLGPNDPVILLEEVLRLPGLVYPVWGADHYLRPSWELRELARAILEYLAEQLGLLATPAAAEGGTR